MTPAKQNTTPVGRSQTGYTPQGNKGLAPYDASMDMSCRVEDPKGIRPTWLLFRPELLTSKIEKYAALRCILSGPSVPRYSLLPVATIDAMNLIAQHRFCQAAPVEPAPHPTVAMRTGRGSKSPKVPVVCLDTGRYFPSQSAYGKRYRLSPQIMQYAEKRGITAKGHSFRAATAEEIKQAESNPNWLAPDKLTGKFIHQLALPL